VLGIFSELKPVRNHGASSTTKKPQLAFKLRTPINDEVSKTYYTVARGKEEEGEGEGERMHEWGLESERGWKSKVGLPPAS
jgi:hypothetical protein